MKFPFTFGALIGSIMLLAGEFLKVDGNSKVLGAILGIWLVIAVGVDLLLDRSVK